MESRKIVYRETAIMALGEGICLAVMLLIYWLLGYLHVSVVLGGLAGTVVAILNFFFMALVTSLAADKAQNQDVEGGQKLVKGAYPIRIILVALILAACAKSGWFDILTLVLPLLFIRPIITVAEFFRKKGA